jgi:hypothetical protein
VSDPCGTYWTFLQRVHRALAPRTYLEIGVAEGTTLAFAGADTVAVGVDPAPELVEPVPPTTTVFAETSDAFFATRDLGALFGGRGVDLAFVDGMHLFEFALRDFVNVERHCHPSSTVLLHDCDPTDEAMAARERTTCAWAGDVWKLLAVFADHRSDLEVTVVDVAPTGVAVVRGLDPTSSVLADEYDAIVARYRPLEYAWLEEHRAALARRVADDWDEIAPMLTRDPGRCR